MEEGIPRSIAEALRRIEAMAEIPSGRMRLGLRGRRGGRGPRRPEAGDVPVRPDKPLTLTGGAAVALVFEKDFEVLKVRGSGSCFGRGRAE